MNTQILGILAIPMVVWLFAIFGYWMVSRDLTAAFKFASAFVGACIAGCLVLVGLAWAFHPLIVRLSGG